ncbi:MAG: ATP-binding protein [Myxococcaceae bacterium]
MADRRLARRVLIGLGLLAVLALLVPLMGYRTDVAEARRLLHARVSREAAVYADALDTHVRALEAELLRLASRPQIDLRDETTAPERELLDFAHHNSAFFAGVAVLDDKGRPVWSEPKDALPPGTLERRRWFQKMLLRQAPVIDALEPGARTFVVAVPVVRGDEVTGAVVGLVDPSRHVLPGGRTVSENLELVVADRDGDVLAPAIPPAWVNAEFFPDRLDQLLAQGPGETRSLSGAPEFAVATQVGKTGLRLLLVADEAAMLAPVRQRFLGQLLLAMVLQGLTVLLFTLFLRQTYQTWRAMETRATQQEKMAALGTASSLIAHEVKNSLNGLKVATSLLSDGDSTGLATRSIRGQIDRLGHLAQSLLSFGRPAQPQLAEAGLVELVQDALDGVRALPEADEVTVETVLHTPVRVHCDPLLLATALDNLLRNAIEAAVAAKDLGRQPSPRVHVEAGAQGDLAWVTVEDNAGGPPAGFEGQLFQPFVTSKPKGIGLGLSMARQAVERQGGHLGFQRTEAGSRFTIELQRAKAAA